MMLTHLLPLAWPKGLPIYVARFPSAPFTLGWQLGIFVPRLVNYFERKVSST